MHFSHCERLVFRGSMLKSAKHIKKYPQPIQHSTAQIYWGLHTVGWMQQVQGVGHPRLATLSLGGGSSSCYLASDHWPGPLLIAASGLPSCHLATLPPCPAPAVNLYLALGRRGLGLRWAVAAGFCFGRATPPFAAQRSGCEGGAGPAPAAVRGYIWPRCRGSAIRIPAAAWCLLYLWFQLPKVCLFTTITGNPASTASST